MGLVDAHRRRDARVARAEGDLALQQAGMRAHRFGQAGIGGHITLAKGTKAGGQTGIAFDTEPNSYLNGTPALPYMVERRLQIMHQKLPELFRRVDFLEQKLEKASAPA